MTHSRLIGLAELVAHLGFSFFGTLSLDFSYAVGTLENNFLIYGWAVDSFWADFALLSWWHTWGFLLKEGG
jgi:hypothetical protein